MYYEPNILKDFRITIKIFSCTLKFKICFCITCFAKKTESFLLALQNVALLINIMTMDKSIQDCQKT